MISGFRGSGKDTLGNLIIKNKFNNLVFERYASADQVKDIASKKYKFKREFADIPSEKDMARSEYNGQSIRDLVREECVLIKGAYSDKLAEIIVDKMLHRLEDNPNLNFVVTDFRFECAYNTFVKNFGKENITTVRVSRQGIEIPNETKEPEEYGLKDFIFDVYVDNNGTVEQLWNNFNIIQHNNHRILF